MSTVSNVRVQRVSRHFRVHSIFSRAFFKTLPLSQKAFSRFERDKCQNDGIIVARFQSLTFSSLRCYNTPYTELFILEQVVNVGSQHLFHTIRVEERNCCLKEENKLKSAVHQCLSFTAERLCPASLILATTNQVNLQTSALISALCSSITYHVQLKVKPHLH